MAQGYHQGWQGWQSNLGTTGTGGYHPQPHPMIEPRANDVMRFPSVAAKWESTGTQVIYEVAMTAAQLSQLTDVLVTDNSEVSEAVSALVKIHDADNEADFVATASPSKWAELAMAQAYAWFGMEALRWFRVSFWVEGRRYSMNLMVLGATADAEGAQVLYLYSDLRGGFAVHRHVFDKLQFEFRWLTPADAVIPEDMRAHSHVRLTEATVTGLRPLRQRARESVSAVRDPSVGPSRSYSPDPQDPAQQQAQHQAVPEWQPCQDCEVRKGRMDTYAAAAQAANDRSEAMRLETDLMRQQLVAAESSRSAAESKAADLEAKLAVAQAKTAHHEHALSLSQERSDALQKDLAEARFENTKLKYGASAKVQQAQSDVEKAQAEARQEVTRADHAARQAQDEVRALQADRDDLARQIANAQLNDDDHARRFSAAKREAEALAAQVRTLEKQLDSEKRMARASQAGFQNEHAVLSAELQKTSTDRDDARAKITELQFQISRMTTDVSGAKESFRNAQEKADAATRAHRKLLTEHEAVTKENAALKNEVSQHKATAVQQQEWDSLTARADEASARTQTAVK